METVPCYRFVENDLTSANGDMSWRVGEWNKVSGPIACCSSGLHASSTPRDSLRNVYGQRWFIAEAKGEISHRGHKFAASEMRLVEEIPVTVLRRFAIRCAKDSLDYIERRQPLDTRIHQCIEAAQGYLHGELREEELLQGRQAVGDALASGAVAGADTGRATAAAIAASCAANGDAASWTAAAAAAAYAAHVAADAIKAVGALTATYATVHDVAAGIAAAQAADHAAACAHTAAAAGAVAHAAGVAAARGAYAADTVSDPYFVAFSAFAEHPADHHYRAQNAVLLELIGDSTGTRT
ncbi:hypothetical protein [Streptomyces sp. 11-1-2]|uniref:DUF7666 domain-containing protein n=1 Tax=unclassified Streptomyces TaxID=2593676 RepID=UPI000B8DA6BF|nr:hypothetical protein [Streptomyces sp. 11-1-2]ASQ97467.1 hypothetical protein CGL27_34515 [Streptomyces sp. 11-1-2]